MDPMYMDNTIDMSTGTSCKTETHYITNLVAVNNRVRARSPYLLRTCTCLYRNFINYKTHTIIYKVINGI